MEKVIVYSTGLVHCSVCADNSLSVDEVVNAVNLDNPTGLAKGWFLDGEGEFAGGQPNPCPCDKEPDTRKHYLLTC